MSSPQQLSQSQNSSFLLTFLFLSTQLVSRVSIPNTIEELSRLPLPDSRTPYTPSRIPVLISPKYRTNLTSVPTTSTTLTYFYQSISNTTHISLTTPTDPHLPATLTITKADMSHTHAIDSYFMPAASSSGVRPNIFWFITRARR